MSAIIFQLLPKPLLTQDQLRLLKYDNIVSHKYKTNADIGVPKYSIILKMKLKNIVICGKRVVNFIPEKYEIKKISMINFKN